MLAGVMVTIKVCAPFRTPQELLSGVDALDEALHGGALHRIALMGFLG
jgi:hypothetical protein